MDVVAPASVDELSDVMRASAASRQSVRARGNGTKWSWGADAPEPELAVETSGLARLVEHAAGDLVVTTEAGARLADVQTVLGDAGQWLALDPPEPDATIGGVVATASSGPRRLRYGTARDLLIGVTVVLADGTVARSGGKVVKNVAGYDLGKLFTGSFGTLGVVAQCTFRLHPLAPSRRVVVVPTADPAGLVRAILRSPLEPSALEYDGKTLVTLFETVETAAEAQARDLVALAGGGEVTDQTPPDFGARPSGPDDLALKVTHRLSSFAVVLGAVRRRLPDCRLLAHAGTGVIDVGWPVAPDDAVAVAGALDGLRGDVATHAGTVVVVDAPPQVKQALDVWGPVSGLDVMRRVKAQFDPDGRMSPGRFVGGI